MKRVNDLKPLFIFAKSFILDTSQCPKHFSDNEFPCSVCQYVMMSASLKHICHINLFLLKINFLTFNASIF